MTTEDTHIITNLVMDLSQEIVKSDAAAQTLLKGAKALRDNGQLFDFNIIVDGTRFASHKVILAAFSDFFRAMFQHPESIEFKTNECNLKDIPPTIFKTILDFCYSSIIGIGNENVQEILMAASILQINTIQSLCVEYIIKMMDATNCLGILILADRCNLAILIESALSFCLDKFEDVVEEDEFPRLNASFLSRILSHDKLHVENEERVLSAVLKWIAADKDRAKELDNLVAHVRFPLMSPRSLVILSTADQIQKSKKCRDLILEAKHYHPLEGFPEDELRTQMVGKRFEPRCPLRRQPSIFAVGGYNEEFENTQTVEKYDPQLDKWVEIKGLAKTRDGAGVLILNDCLYAIGGCERRVLSSVECYNINGDFWRYDVADMKFPRSGINVCTLGGQIYAIGGLDDGCVSTNVVERYDPRTNKWEECAPLRDERNYAGVTVCNNSIYVLGGRRPVLSPGSPLVHCNTVEKFDARKNEWSSVATMTTTRFNFGCTALEGKIYVVGGFNLADGMLKTAECYDPIEDRWEPIPPMSVERRNLGLAELDGLIYAVGGTTYADNEDDEDDDDIPLKLVEAYDPVKKEWTTKCPMIHSRGGLSSCLASYSPVKQRWLLQA